MDQDTSVIHESIERDRAELAATIEALARKVDVKERMRESMSNGVQRVEDTARQVAGQFGDGSSGLDPKVKQFVDVVKANPVPFVAVTALLVGYLVGRALHRG